MTLSEVVVRRRRGLRWYFACTVGEMMFQWLRSGVCAAAVLVPISSALHVGGRCVLTHTQCWKLTSQPCCCCWDCGARGDHWALGLQSQDRVKAGRLVLEHGVCTESSGTLEESQELWHQRSGFLSSSWQGAKENLAKRIKENLPDFQEKPPLCIVHYFLLYFPDVTRASRWEIWKSLSSINLFLK